jgi:hypothetical protein
MVATVSLLVAFLDTPNCWAAGDRQQQAGYVVFYKAFIQKELHKPAVTILV